tara:strand:- start:358 stop:645 length:288 start_codon:yes stop_codon:yes gene_type:complete
MKEYYTIKLKLTPLQIEMFEDVITEGVTGRIDNCEGGEENRLIAVERKIVSALHEYNYDLQVAKEFRRTSLEQAHQRGLQARKQREENNQRNNDE